MVGYGVIDVQDNVLRFFAIDHVLVGLSFVTIATTGAIFSVQFNRAPPGSAGGAWALPQIP